MNCDTVRTLLRISSLHLTWYFIIQRLKPKTKSIHTLFIIAYSFRRIELVLVQDRWPVRG